MCRFLLALGIVFVGGATTVGQTGGVISFLSSTLVTNENAGSVVITVQRTGNTSQAVAVHYTTADHSGSPGVFPCSTVNGTASSRCGYTSAGGTLIFAAGQTSRQFKVLISQDSYTEGTENVQVTLSDPNNGAVLCTPSTATLQISDDPIEPNFNVIDDTLNFVTQHYHDFLNREPDPDGLQFWANQIFGCGSKSSCIEATRVHVSAAFFLSIEFQQTGFFVYRLYKVSYGDIQDLPVPLRFNEFLPDAQQISQGVLVGVGNWEAQLEANKVAYLADFVNRSRFLSAYPTSLTPDQFVDMLIENVPRILTLNREALIAEFGGAANSSDTAARGRVLRAIVDNKAFVQQQFEPAFVTMQYFGYMRRNPDATPDVNFNGWQFWLDKLNQFNGNFIEAEMVKAFISSGEYRARFGSQ